jgi:hypothetical protein
VSASLAEELQQLRLQRMIVALLAHDAGLLSFV